MPPPSPPVSISPQPVPPQLLLPQLPPQQPPPQLSQLLPPLHEQILKSLPVIPPCLLLDASKTDPITYEQVTQFAQEFFEEGELFCFPSALLIFF